MNKMYDAIVIGGSAAGLSATLSMARALLSVVCVDAGKPCNRYATESHNLITHDGDSPSQIGQSARSQIEKYRTVSFIDDVAQALKKEDDGTFTVETKNGVALKARALILATGMNDNIETANIKNMAQFWGNSIFTCPYCHGFEYAGKKAGVYLENQAFMGMILPILYNWNKDITIFTNQSVINDIGSVVLEERGVDAVAASVVAVEGEGNQVKSVTLSNGDNVELDVLYYAPKSTINMKDSIVSLGVELDAMGLINVEKPFMKTSVEGVFAAGDNCNMMRSLAISTYSGQMAGSSVAHTLFNSRWSSAGTF